MEQPFIIIFASKDINVFEYEIKNKIKEELPDQTLLYQ